MSWPLAMARVAQYTLSTMRAPTQATPDGSTPARMVQKPSRNDSGLLVRPEELERALAVLEDAEELARGIEGLAVDFGSVGELGLGGHLRAARLP